MASQPKEDRGRILYDPEIAELMIGRNHQIGVRPVNVGNRVTKENAKIEAINPRVQNVVSLLLWNLKNAQETPP